MLLHLIILALVQGITEFLPISSSGHLVLTHALLDRHEGQDFWAENLKLDVAVHVGTLFSVLVYFRRDVATMFAGLRDWAFGDWRAAGSRLNFQIIISSVPVIGAGFVLFALEPSWLHSLQIIAWTTLVFGILLWMVDARQPVQKSLEDLSYRDAFLIGLAQMLALIPGTSRSGITMTAARALGYSRTDAARYSILLAIIAIGGAGTLATLDLVQSGNASLTYDALIAAVLAFLSGWLAIAVMMKWLEKASFTIFAVYRIILGVALLGLIYGGFIQ